MEKQRGIVALKSGIWYTLANFFSKGIVFISMPVFTRLLSKSEVGDYSNFVSWLTILSSIITLDLFTSVILAKYDFKDKFQDYISSILVLGSLFTITVYIISVLFEEPIKNLLGLNTLEFHMLFVYAVFSPALNIFEMRNRVEYKYRSTVIISMGSTVACTLISLLCTYLFSNKLLGRLLGFYLPSCIVNIGLYIFLFKRCNCINLKYWKYALAISLPLIVHVLSGRLLSSCDRVMIKSICGNEDTALYSVAYSCTMIISVLWNSINSAWTPWAIEQMNDNNKEKLRKAARPYLIFVGLMILCFFLVAPEILLIMGGKSYSSALYVLPPVLLGNVFQFVYSLYVNVETFLKKQRYIALGTALAAVINLLLNFLLIPLYGYIAAAYTTLIGYSLLLVIHYIIVLRLKAVDWYDNKFNLLFLLSFCLIIPLSFILYTYSIIRYSIIGLTACCVIVLLFIFKNEIKLLIKEKSISKFIEQIKKRLYRNIQL